MQRIEIVSEQVHVKSGTAKSGKPYTIREQEAFLHTPGRRYPETCRVVLESEQAPYAPGVYEVTAPLGVGRFDALQVNRSLGLVAVKAKAA